MNILVTGAHGLIGTNLVSKLKEMNHNVITVDLNHNADYVLDISSDDLLQIEDPIDIIYHLLVIKTFTKKEPIGMLKQITD